jgi:dihydropteroate synthase
MQRDPLIWRVGERDIDCSERTLVMGILNVTPDSFSDGGQLANTDAAVARGVQMLADGADILDVGGESTRPGSDPVTAEEEMARTLPVIERLVAEAPGVPVSIDTRKAEVAAAAISSGASIVNDVSAGADPSMFATAAETNAAMVLMHMQGDPKTMQSDPHYEDVVGDVAAFLTARLDAAVAAGLERDSLVIDPGIGFGKTLEHNLALMKNIDAFSALGRPILIGPSRKRFIGTLLGTEVDDRLEGTAAAVAWLAGSGAHIVRVHDVKEMVRVVRVVDAIVRS